MKLFISPHDDDHALFGAFTCLREHPVLVIVFDGHLQSQRGLPVTAEQRAKETALAADILGCERVVRLGFSDADPVTSSQIANRLIDHFGEYSSQNQVWLPAAETDGHEQHNHVAGLLNQRANVTRYLTYTRNGGKSTNGRPVPIESGDWVASKLQALSVYKSQMSIDPRMGCLAHFLREMNEYYL